MPNYSQFSEHMARAPSKQQKPRIDVGVPNYDRSKDRGNYLVMSLTDGKVEFSSYCSSFSRALAMTRLSKRQPTWVLHGLEEELLAIRRVCAVNASWITPKMMDNLVKTQLGKTISILTTFHV